MIILALGSFTSLPKNSKSFSYLTLLPKKSLKVARILDDNDISLISNLIADDLEKACIIGNNEELIASFKVVLPNITIDKVDEWNNILSKDVIIKIEKITPGMMDYFFQFAPWILIIVFWFFIMKRMQGGGGQGGIFSFAKSKAKIIGCEGELPVRIKPDDPADFVEGLLHGKIISVELLPEESILFKGKAFELSEIKFL